MNKKWHYKPRPPAEQIQALRTLLHTSIPSSTLLLQRGITDFDKAKAFFNPHLDQLHEPFQMKGMAQAVKRLTRAIQQREHIRIYGDYDVDGITSVALLYQVLQQRGAHVSYYIPDRYTEGYGLSAQGLQKAIQEKVQLLILLDCGTRAVALAAHAQSGGMALLICDHHEPGPALPDAEALLNPKQKDCPYPFTELSACGIVFKLVQALCQREKKYTPPLQGYLDLVALSIAADIVPMRDENRILAALGLEQLNKNPSLGVGVLKERVFPQGSLRISDVVFRLSPPLNAAGRMAHAHDALRLLLAKNKKEAAHQAAHVHQQNQVRQEKDRTLTKEALAMIQEMDGSSFTHVLYQPHWRKGLVGIGAARCIEHHYKPTILLTHEKKMAVGSARSIESFNMHEALTACKHLLHKYGGHAHAAGLTLPLAHLAEFRAAFEAYARTQLSSEELLPKQEIDIKLELTQITPAFVQFLERMRPFGPCNRAPVFATEPVRALRYTLYQEKHLKLWLQGADRGKTWAAIGFNMAEKLPWVEKNRPFAIAYKIELDAYRGTRREQLVLKDLRPCAVESS